MARKTENKTIGGRNYQIRQLGSDTADAVLARLLLGAGTGSLTVTDIMAAKGELMANTKVGIVDVHGNGAENFVPLATVYDDLLADALGDRLEWLLAAFEVTFGPFSGAGERLAGFRAGLLSLISQATRGGSSTASSSPTG